MKAWREKKRQEIKAELERQTDLATIRRFYLPGYNKYHMSPDCSVRKEMPKAFLTEILAENPNVKPCRVCIMKSDPPHLTAAEWAYGLGSEDLPEAERFPIYFSNNYITPCYHHSENCGPKDKFEIALTDLPPEIMPCGTCCTKIGADEYRRLQKQESKLPYWPVQDRPDVFLLEKGQRKAPKNGVAYPKKLVAQSKYSQKYEKETKRAEKRKADEAFQKAERKRSKIKRIKLNSDSAHKEQNLDYHRKRMRLKTKNAHENGTSNHQKVQKKTHDDDAEKENGVVCPKPQFGQRSSLPRSKSGRKSYDANKTQNNKESVPNPLVELKDPNNPSIFIGKIYRLPEINNAFDSWRQQERKHPVGPNETPIDDEIKEVLLLLPCYYCDQVADPKFPCRPDRVNNAEGYSLQNLVPCCQRCNYMKKDLSLPNFLRLAFNVAIAGCNEFTPAYLKTDEMALPSWSKFCNNAKRRGISIEFNQETYEAMKLEPNQKCYICHRPGTFGFDRVDNSKAYTVENSKNCCAPCNYMKKDQSLQDFISKCQGIASFTPCRPTKEYVQSTVVAMSITLRRFREPSETAIVVRKDAKIGKRGPHIFTEVKETAEWYQRIVWRADRSKTYHYNKNCQFAAVLNAHILQDEISAGYNACRNCVYDVTKNQIKGMSDVRLIPLLE